MVQLLHDNGYVTASRTDGDHRDYVMIHGPFSETQRSEYDGHWARTKDWVQWVECNDMMVSSRVTSSLTSLMIMIYWSKLSTTPGRSSSQNIASPSRAQFSAVAWRKYIPSTSFPIFFLYKNCNFWSSKCGVRCTAASTHACLHCLAEINDWKGIEKKKCFGGCVSTQMHRVY